MAQPLGGSLDLSAILDPDRVGGRGEIKWKPRDNMALFAGASGWRDFGLKTWGYQIDTGFRITW